MKKIFTLILCLLLCGSLLAACNNDTSGGSSSESQSSQSQTSAETGTADNEPVTIKVANWDTDTSTAYVKVLVEAFKEVAPHITVEILDTPSADYTQKLSVMLNGGSDVDAFWIKDGDTTRGLATKGQLADLSAYIERDGIDLSEYAGLAERFQMDGKIVAMPASTGYYILYYNKDIFDAANVEYPSNDMTWAEFEALAAQVTSGTGADKKYGAFIHTWQACVQNWGVQDGQNTIMDYSTGYDFFRPYYEMVLRMQDDGTIMDYATLKTGEIHYSSPFLQGNVAMLPMGTWFFTTIIEKMNAGETEVNWGIATLPHPDNVEAGYTVGSVTPIAINEASTKKDAAWEFVKFVTSEEGAKIYAAGGAIPSRANDQTLVEIATAPGMPEGALEALEVKNIALDRPMEDFVAEVNTMLGEQHSLIMLKEVSIDDGLAAMAAQSQELQGQ